MEDLTIFVISTLLLKRGVRASLYFYEKGASFEKAREPTP